MIGLIKGMVLMGFIGLMLYSMKILSFDLPLLKEKYKKAKLIVKSIVSRVKKIFGK